MGMLRKNTAALLAAVALATGGAITTATPASAAQTCPADNLCLYSSTGFNDMKMRTVQTSVCFALSTFQLIGDRHIMSYDNNLSVKAVLWHTRSLDQSWISDGAISAGGFSSNTGGNFNDAVVVCTGGRSPYWPGI
ncbi:hypothetical protein ABZV34_37495 [Streptomyces sp. NPDC005195]|uniref:hypothetical protein n=1 Tax=Streptomyces sp. NPDC005195 TaxID=3154561 RepID=UPI0033AD656A